MKVLWDWRDGSVLKSTCCFAEGSGWVPRTLLVEGKNLLCKVSSELHILEKNNNNNKKGQRVSC